MARVLSEIAAQSAKKFARIENVYVKDSMLLTAISADVNLETAGYIWASMYFYDTTKGVKETINALSCIELESGDSIHTLIEVAKKRGVIASDEKPLNILLYKSKVPLRYRKHSSSNSSINADELF